MNGFIGWLSREMRGSLAGFGYTRGALVVFNGSMRKGRKFDFYVVCVDTRI